MNQKNSLRKNLLIKRASLSPAFCRDADLAIGKHLLSWLTAHQVQSVGVFWPIKNEPDLRALYEQLTAQGVHLALPQVIDKSAPLQFVSWHLNDAMIKDAMGVPIPTSGEQVQPQALIVPCVGFNSQRFRLGYGAGFYDRTLTQCPRPLAVGIGYACLLAQFSADAHDVALDAIVTELGVT